MSDGSDNDFEEVMYKCKQCPGQTFTAAEKDSHRRMHQEQRRDRQGRNRRGREPSPTGTDVTLFLPLSDSPDPEGEKKGPKGRGRPPKKQKITSRKHYDRGVKPTSNDGG